MLKFIDMKRSFEKGISYGITSGVITTLGLIIGLYFSDGTRNIIFAGILTIAFADAFSDGLGIHVSEEAENKKNKRQMWISAISTIFAKMFFALTFALPILIMPLDLALWVDLLWGILLLSILSLFLAKQNKKKPMPFLVEHVGIGAIVIAGSFFVGRIITLFVQ